MYCVYLTTYRGNKLPSFYIGSSSIDNVLNKGYRGSVSSRKYKDIWESELTDNPHLFKTQIIRTTDTREEATSIELKLHIRLNVVKSPMYINMSLAKKNGFGGYDNKGKNHPCYGVTPPAERIKRVAESRRGQKYGKQKENHVKKRIDAQSKSYIIYWPIDGTNKPDPIKTRFEIIRNLAEFVRQYNLANPNNKLNRSAMGKIARKDPEQRHHKGFVVEFC